MGERELAVASLLQAAELETAVQDRVRIAARLCEEAAHTEAERLVRRIAAEHPGDAGASQLLGDVLRELGRFGEAAAVYGQLIQRQPRHASAYLGLVLSRRQNEFDRPLLRAMQQLLQDQRLAGSERAFLHYALAKSNDDLGRYDEAIRHLDAANRLMAGLLERSGRRLDLARHSANIDRLIKIFDRRLFERTRGVDAELPVFVVGMIRSGTTLVEQILSAHPEIASAGETPFWGSHASALVRIEGGQLGADELAKMADDCCAMLRRTSPSAHRIIDKMPTNYMMLGLIHAVFPRARIIHCRRNPLDTCLSIYFTPFRTLPDFAGDRERITSYYEDYARLMAHWREALPKECFLEIDYETLVADREPVVRRLVEFCGARWDDACLSHERNARVVRTPSAWQVRQPLYARSVGRWRHYEDHLGAFARLRGAAANVLP